MASKEELCFVKFAKWLDTDGGAGEGDKRYAIQERRGSADSSALGVSGGRGNEDIFQ